MLIDVKYLTISTWLGSKDCQYGSLKYATLATGKVILCFLIESSQTIEDATSAIHAARVVGVIFAQSTDKLPVSCDLIPCIEVNYEVGTVNNNLQISLIHKSNKNTR